MPPTIIPVATSAASLVWNQGGISSFPPPPGNSVIDNSGFMRTLPPTPPWQGDDSLRHPLWTREGISFPEPLVPSPFTGMSREWAATVSLLLTAGFAQIIDGAARLTDLVRVRGQGVKSRPILHLEELEWILNVHKDNPRINSGVIEPVPFEELIGPAKVLGATSLALLAATARAELGATAAARPFAACQDARKGEVLLEIVGAERIAGIDRVRLLSPAAAAAEIVATAPDAVLVGSAASLVAEAAAASGTRLDLHPRPDLAPHARHLREMPLVPLATPTPLYPRPPDARPQPGEGLDRAALVQPHYAPFAALRAACLYRDAGRWGQASERWKKAAALGHRFGQMHGSLALGLRAAGETDAVVVEIAHCLDCSHFYAPEFTELRTPLPDLAQILANSNDGGQA